MALGDPRKMAMVNVETRMSPMQRNEKLSRNLAALLPYLSVRIVCDFGKFGLLLVFLFQLLSKDHFTLSVF